MAVSIGQATRDDDPRWIQESEQPCRFEDTTGRPRIEHRHVRVIPAPDRRSAGPEHHHSSAPRGHHRPIERYKTLAKPIGQGATDDVSAGQRVTRGARDE
jgi:hypothetical protein